MHRQSRARSLGFQNSNYSLSETQSNLKFRKTFKYPKISQDSKQKRNHSDFITQSQYLRNSMFSLKEKNNIKQKMIVTQKLNSSYENIIIDSQKKEIVGNLAVKQFYKHYKQLDKILEQNQLNQMQQKNLKNLIPCKIGVIKQKGQAEKINISKQSYGDNYIDILSQASIMMKVKSLNFSGNRITEKGVQSLQQMQLGENLKDLDLSQNRIGVQGCEIISKLLCQQSSKLQKLKIEDNNIGDKGANMILESLLQNKQLRILNLNKNKLTDQVSQIKLDF